jgi:hypothetical protein
MVCGKLARGLLSERELSLISKTLREKMHFLLHYLKFQHLLYFLFFVGIIRLQTAGMVKKICVKRKMCLTSNGSANFDAARSATKMCLTTNLHSAEGEKDKC